MTTPDSTQDIIDSRDIIARIEQLQAEIEASMPDPDSIQLHQLYLVLALADEASSHAEDWWSATLIRDSYFIDHAKQRAGDWGYLSSPDPDGWPYSHIDWEAAAAELQQEYTAVDFDGVTYWVR